MANIGPNGFDATQVEPTTDFDTLPAGRYNAEISDSDMRTNSKGTGEYLWLEFTILDGPHAGRKLWSQLNLVNPSSQAVEIAQRELSAICHAVGKLRVQDSIELHNIPLEINVKVKNSPEYGQQNIIRGYKALGGNSRGHVTPAAMPAAPVSQQRQAGSAPVPAATPPGNDGSILPPWKRR